MSDLLFNEFEPVSAKQWKQKIQVDLKGADYNETLIWKTPEGINVKPFYHPDEDGQNVVNIQTKASNWLVGQFFYASNANATNNQIKDALQRGAESILVTIPTAETNLSTLFNGIDLTKYPTYIQLEFLSEEYVSKITNYFSKNHSNATYHILQDIVGNLAKTGNWHANLKEDFTVLKNILSGTKNIENATFLSVNAALYQNAGATIVQQLAYSIAHANEYLNMLNNASLLSNNKNNLITFHVAVGSNYFFEIAKLRALRLLWQTIAKEYNCSANCTIIATPSKRNKTLYDYNVNMLRTTTECMSAVLGGANMVYNLPYDALYHKSNEFGERIARNQLLILKHESYFNKVNNPADGSYYIESLTQQLAQKALEIFKQIEAGGGFINQLKEHTIQQKIKESAKTEQEAFNTKKEVLIGTNKYPNENDRMKHELELHPFVKKNTRKTIVEPIIEKRLAEALEQERLENE